MVLAPAYPRRGRHRRHPGDRPTTARLDDLVGRGAGLGSRAADPRTDGFEGDAREWAEIRAGQPVGALRPAREAVHQGAHHPRLATDELGPPCEHPPAEGDER